MRKQLTTLAGVIVYLHNRPHPVIHGDIRGVNYLFISPSLTNTFLFTTDEHSRE